jgi:arylsulfatase A-like enzyme
MNRAAYSIKVNLLSLLLVFSSAVAGNAQTKKPNIIVIMSDDHAYQAISAYGSKLIQTPNIDRIAKEGMLMKEAAVTNSVCSPSRAVLLTGKYSHMNGMKDNGTYFNGAQLTLPKIYKENGYRTAIVGNGIYLVHRQVSTIGTYYQTKGNYYNPKFKKDGKDTVYTGYVTDVITDMALDWIGKTKDKAPFFLMLHHKAPHRNVMPPLKYLDKFNDKKFPLPSNFYDDYAGRKALQIQQVTMKDHLDIRYDSKIPCDSCPVNEINAWAPAEYQRRNRALNPFRAKNLGCSL